MRGIKIKVIGMLVSVCIILSGCGEWKNYIHTDASLKREAAKALENKYDEEFVIHSVWVASQTTFCVTCSPKDDRDVVFEAEIYKDGRGVLKDEYVQGIVDKQIEEKLQTELQRFFGNCYVKANLFYNETDFETVSDVTMRDYAKKIENAECLVHLFINESEISSDTIAEEYEYFARQISCTINEKEIPKITIHIYIVNDDLMNWCKEYFKVNSKGKGVYYQTVNECYNFGFGYLDGQFNKTLEEYTNLRMGVEINE